MLRQISEDMRVNLKDRLRDIRQGVRQIRHDNRRASVNQTVRPPFPLQEIEGLIGHAAAAFDDAMAIAQTLVPRRTQPGGAPQGLSGYFPAGGAGQRGERAFRRDLYYLAQTVLVKRKITDIAVHESDLAAVHAAMRGWHADRLESLANAIMPAEKVTAAAGACAALLLVLLERHPLHLAAPVFDRQAGSSRLDRSTEIACLAPIALACGLTTIETDDMADADLLDMAMLAAEVRHDRIVEACGKPDALGELTSIFAVLLAHLP